MLGKMVLMLVLIGAQTGPAPLLHAPDDGVPPGTEYTSDIVLTFDGPGYNDSITVPVLKDGRARLSSAMVEVIGAEHNGTYPLSPGLDAGADGVLEWQYDGVGYGNLGRQTGFANGSTSVSFSVDAGSPFTGHIELPISNVVSASLVLNVSSSMQAGHRISISVGNRTVWNVSSDDMLFSSARYMLTAPEPLFSLTSADLRGDTHPEMVAGGRNGGVFIIENATGAYSMSTISTGLGTITRLLTADIDGNTRPDIVGLSWEPSVNRGDVFVARNTNGTFTSAVPVYTFPMRPYGISAARLDTDPGIDLLVAAGGKMLPLMNSGTGTFSPGAWIQGCSGLIRDVAVSELTGDGEPDAAAICENGETLLVNGTAAGLSSNVSRIGSLPLEPTRLSLGDLDGNGSVDMAVGMVTGRIGMLSNLGGGIFSAPLILDVGSPQRILDVEVKDVDNDSRRDVVLTDPTTATFILRNRGYPSFSKVVLPYTNLATMNDLTMTDVDADGDRDILGANIDGGLYMMQNILSGFESRIPLKKGIEDLFSNATPNPDAWGNPMVDVGITVSATHPTTASIRGIDVIYNHTSNVNITGPLAKYRDGHPGNATGFVNVPLNLSVGSAGKLMLHISLSYSRTPPYLISAIPSTYAFPEDTVGKDLIDLERYFGDDQDDGSLTFTVSYEEDPARLHAVVSGGHLTFYPAQHWSGSMRFRVSAADSDGMVTESNTFSVSVVHVNHPPEFRGMPPSLKVIENTTFTFDTAPYIYDVEDGSNLTLSTSDPGNISVSGTLLGITYPGSNYTRQVGLTITDRENASASTPLDIIVRAYGSPVFHPIPPWRTPAGANVSASASPLDLKAFVEDADTSKDALMFSVVSQSHPDVNVHLNGSRLGISFLRRGVTGSSTVTLEVSDGLWSDRTDLQVIFTGEIVYLGGLKDGLAFEDVTWSVDLSPAFNMLNVSYLASDTRVHINGSTASWTPAHGDASMRDLTFTAYDPLDPGNNATSPPINLTYVEVNDAPVYLGGLSDQVVFEGDSWQVDLNDHFTDEEFPDRLIYTSSSANVTINGSWATWTPGPGSQSVHELTFTAVDWEDEALTAVSPPIELIYVRVNLPPEAVIDSVSPLTAYMGTGIRFTGHGVDPDGNITGYIWRSDRDGPIGNTSDFERVLSPGIHTITFQVKDDRDTWSDPAYVNVTVLSYPPPTPDDQQKIVLAGGMMAGGLLILASGAYLYMLRRRRGGTRGAA